MSSRKAVFLVMAVVLVFLLSGIVYAAKLKIKIDPKTGKPVVKTDVPVISSSRTSEGWTVLTLATGESVSYFVDQAGNVSVQPIIGKIEVITPNATVSLEPGDAVSISINKETGAVQIATIKGAVEVSAQGRRQVLREGQQSTITAGAPPSAPTHIARIPKLPPAPVITPPPAMAPSPPPAPPKPPKYEVNPNVVPPPIAKGMQVEEFHGLRPASPAE